MPNSRSIALQREGDGAVGAGLEQNKNVRLVKLLPMSIKIDPQATIQAIRNCIGKVVVDIVRVQYFYNDMEDNDGFGDLEITFVGDFHLTLIGGGDADSMMAENVKADIPKTFRLSDDDIASWKSLDLKEDQNWRKLIGQTLRSAEVEWNTYSNVPTFLSACVLHFDTDYLTFYKTETDANKFFLNQPLPGVDRPIKLEKVQ